MVFGDYVYALCGKPELLKGGFSSWRQINPSYYPTPIVIESFNLFTTKRGDYVIRASEIKKERELVHAIITDHLEQKPILVKIPLDDIVSAEDIVAPAK